MIERQGPRSTICAFVSLVVCVCRSTDASGKEGLSKQSEARPSESPLWGSTVRVTAAIIWPVDWPDLPIDGIMSPYNGWGYCALRWLALNELADLNSFGFSHGGRKWNSFVEEVMLVKRKIPANLKWIWIWSLAEKLEGIKSLLCQYSEHLWNKHRGYG